MRTPGIVILILRVTTIIANYCIWIEVHFDYSEYSAPFSYINSITSMGAHLGDNAKYCVRWVPYLNSEINSIKPYLGSQLLLQTIAYG